MLDPQRFIIALKSSLVSRLVDTENKGQWKHIYITQFKIMGGILTFECNLDKKETEHIFKKYSFIYNVLLSWIDINLKNEHKSSISSEILWNNVELKINNSTKKLFDKEIKYVKNIYDYDRNVFILL